MGAPPLVEAEAIARAVRGGLMRHAGDARAPAISGHEASGAPLERRHVAILPVPVRDATGGLRVGGAVVRLPDDAGPVLEALHTWQRSGMRLVLGTLGVWQLVWMREDGDAWRQLVAPLVGTARVWATLTPIALDRNPGNLFHRDAVKRRLAWRAAEEAITEGCLRAGLPRPVRVRAATDGALAGVPPAGRFMPYPRDTRKGTRVCVHAAIEFGEPVAGPVALGAGRYFGVGVGAIVASVQAPA